MKRHMMRAISSPSSSTTGRSTLILVIDRPYASAEPGTGRAGTDDTGGYQVKQAAARCGKAADADGDGRFVTVTNFRCQLALALSAATESTPRAAPGRWQRQKASRGRPARQSPA